MIELSYAKKMASENQFTGIYQAVEEKKMSYLDSFSDGFRLNVQTPMPQPRNSSLYITDSNFSAIYQEIRKTHYLIVCKNKSKETQGKGQQLPGHSMLEKVFLQNFHSDDTFLDQIFDFMFFQQDLPMLKDINYLLKLEVISKDVCFEGLLDSRIKFLRSCIENHYKELQMRQQQYQFSLF